MTTTPRIRRRPERIYTLEVSMDPGLVKQLKAYAVNVNRNVSQCVTYAVRALVANGGSK